MSVRHAMPRLCAVEENAIPPAERRRALITLAAIVGGALVVQVASAWLDRPAAMWSNVVAQLSLPLLVAWSVRRFAGSRIFAMVAIMVVGLLAPLLLSEPAEWTTQFTPNAMVAAGMTWIIGTQVPVSTREMLFSAIVLAVAFALSALI